MGAMTNFFVGLPKQGAPRSVDKVIATALADDAITGDEATQIIRATGRYVDRFEHDAIAKVASKNAVLGEFLDRTIPSWVSNRLSFVAYGLGRYVTEAAADVAASLNVDS